MSHDTQNMNDPLSFVRSLWSGMGVTMPGMVTPTFDVDELDKRIKDMKAVEGWLRMNLSMLQMTIQGLEMQRTTLGTVQAMSQMASNAANSISPEAAADPVPAVRGDAARARHARSGGPGRRVRRRAGAPGRRGGGRDADPGPGRNHQCRRCSQSGQCIRHSIFISRYEHYVHKRLGMVILRKKGP